VAHREQQRFCRSIRQKYPDYFKSKQRVLDVGSGDVNGNNKYLFDGCDDLEYHGCDVAAGPNVTIVSFCHELPFESESFDVIVSTECFEHDLYWAASFRKIYQMLRPNGMLLFTCATTGREEHGTIRSGSPYGSFTTKINQEYYRNITEDDVRLALRLEQGTMEYEMSTRSKPMADIYFVGIKTGGE